MLLRALDPKGVAENSLNLACDLYQAALKWNFIISVISKTNTDPVFEQMLSLFGIHAS